MRLYKVEGVVLRARDCGNADKLLILMTREQGKIKVMAHGAAKPASRKRGATQLFAHARFLLHRGRELDAISQAEVIEMFSFLRNDLERMVYASYLAELVDAFAPEGEPQPLLFNLLLAFMHLLSKNNGELLTAAFAMRILSLLGYRPLLEHCAACQGPAAGSLFFSPAAGGVLCAVCRPADPAAMPVNRGVLEMLKLLLSWSPAKLHRLKIDRAARHEIRRLLQAYIRYYLERDLKSATFLERWPRERAGDVPVHV